MEFDLRPWQAGVLADLIPFCDLGTTPNTVPYVGHLEVKWQRNERLHTTEFRRDGGHIVVRDNDRAPIDYRSFLASSEMANLKQIAERIRTLSRKRREESRRVVARDNVYTDDWYVDPHVSVLRGDEVRRTARAADAMSGLLDEVDVDADQYTDLVFFTAQAGQGKSSSLRRVHARQAEKYCQGKTTRLTFFVDAQGRGLSKLTDVLSRELNELRLSLHHSAIFALVREGLLTLIVDGFDELVGARGTYDGAFASLTNFLELLDGRGQVIAAARSAFFSQEYLDRPHVLSGSSGRHIISRVELLPWDDDDRAEFLQAATESSRQGLVTRVVADRFRQLQSTDQAGLLHRPLFSRDVLLALIQDPSLKSDGSDIGLIENVVENYIVREVDEKLLDSAGQPLVSANQMKDFFAEFSGEMWQLETREIDVSTARVQMDLMTELWSIDGEASRILRDRVGQLPFFASGDVGAGTIKFEHEIFFAYFISKPLHEAIFGLETATSLSTLARARMTEDECDLVMRRASDGQPRREALRHLSALAGTRHPRQAQIQVNCGSLAASVLRAWDSTDDGKSGASIHNLLFEGDSLRNAQIRNLEARNCVFNRVDLSGAQIYGSVTDTDIYSAIVDPETTRLLLLGLDEELPIMQIEVIQDGRNTPVYDQHQRDNILARIGLMSDEPNKRFAISEERESVITQLCKAFDEMNPVGDRHKRYARVFDSSEWKHVRAFLLESELVREDTKASSGPRQLFYRKNFQTADLLAVQFKASDDPALERFWSRMSSS